MKRILKYEYMLVIFLNISIKRVISWGIVGNPLAFAHLCNGTDKILATYESGLAPDEENQYQLGIREKFQSHSKIEIKFDHGAQVILTNPNISRISTNSLIPNTFLIRFFKSAENDFYSMQVKGTSKGIIPYPLSININNDEFCEQPNTGVLDNLIIGVKDSAISIDLQASRSTCGRRQVDHTELITNSQPTKPGDWPWHAAIYRFEKGSLTYKCGGTLVSKNVIVTAAHCTTIRGAPLSPEIINVVLGKYNLVGGDIGIQDKEVHEIVVHAKYNPSNLDNDISILKLRTEAVFGDYVQPACIWNPEVVARINTTPIFGTVVGWGFDHTDQLSSQLRQATMPKVSESTCLKSDPLFFGRLLNDHKFCAGYKNGTSACNGDSGGGFSVFVPDEMNEKENSNAPGSWYLRGIVSVGVSRRNIAICDPNQFVIFTDLAKYRSWIEKHIK